MGDVDWTRPPGETLVQVLPDLLGGPPLRGAEVGVLRGATARILLDTFPDLLLWCVDDWRLCGIVKETPATIRAQALESLVMHGERVVMMEMPSEAVGRQMLGSGLDFVHLDASHDGGSLKWDMIWTSAIRPGGVICGHDYGHPDYPEVREVVDATFAEPDAVLNGCWFVQL